MARPKLRIYYGPQGEESSTAVAGASARPDRTTVPLGDILPLLADAYRERRLWLEDFDDEEVTISVDLYEILLAYENLHRPSA